MGGQDRPALICLVIQHAHASVLTRGSRYLPVSLISEHHLPFYIALLEIVQVMLRMQTLISMVSGVSIFVFVAFNKGMR